MNSVHKPGPNSDSQTSPSRKPGRKTKPGARAPSWPSWHAQASAWPRAGGRIVAGSRPCHGQGPVVSWAPQRRVMACARAPVPSAPTPCLGSPATVSWAPNGRIVAWPPSRVAIQPISCKPQVTIHSSVLRYTSPAAIPFSHDTVSVL